MLMPLYIPLSLTIAFLSKVYQSSARLASNNRRISLGRAAPTSAAFAGAGARKMSVPPIRGRSSEDSLRISAQLRLTFACRRKTNTEEPNSVEKGAHRRKAPAPVRVCFAGAGASVNFVPPASHRSTEDSIRIRGQLRLGSGNRRRAGHWHRTSDEGAFVGGGRHPRAVDDFVQNFFNISVTFPFTNYTYRGIIICIQPKLKNFVK